jgi:hypothetical protein
MNSDKVMEFAVNLGRSLLPRQMELTEPHWNRLSDSVLEVLRTSPKDCCLTNKINIVDAFTRFTKFEPEKSVAITVQAFLFKTLKSLNDELKATPDWKDLCDPTVIDLWISTLSSICRSRSMHSGTLVGATMKEIVTAITMVYQIAKPSIEVPLWPHLPSILLFICDVRPDVKFETFLALNLDNLALKVNLTMKALLSDEGHLYNVPFNEAALDAELSLGVRGEGLWNALPLVEMALRNMVRSMRPSSAQFPMTQDNTEIFQKLCDAVNSVVYIAVKIILRLSQWFDARDKISNGLQSAGLNLIFGASRTVLKTIEALRLRPVHLCVENLLSVCMSICQQRECMTPLLNMIKFMRFNSYDCDVIVESNEGKVTVIDDSVYGFSGCDNCWQVPLLCCNSACINMDGKHEFGLRTMVCTGGCGMRYCSRACQVEAWRAGHKHECAKEKKVLSESIAKILPCGDSVPLSSEKTKPQKLKSFPYTLICEAYEAGEVYGAYEEQKKEKRRSRVVIPGSVMAITVKVEMGTVRVDMALLPNDSIVKTCAMMLSVEHVVLLRKTQDSLVLVSDTDTAVTLGMEDMGEILYCKI